MGNTGWRAVVAAVVVLWMAAGVACGKIIYVDDDANSPGDGRGWATAYRYLQDALADANSSPKPVEVRVAQGVYRPDRNASEPNGTGDRLASFELVSGVALMGGYAGLGAVDPNARDVRRYETVLSGDIGTPGALWDNSYHVLLSLEVDQTAILDGFAISGGNADGWYFDDHGGAMRNSGSPLIARCVFEANTAFSSGGAVYNEGGALTFRECAFLRNGSVGNLQYLCERGGAIISPFGSVRLVNCLFAGNSAVLCGAVDESSGTVVAEKCTFWGNRAIWDGGAIYAFRGAVVIHESILWGNVAWRSSGQAAQIQADQVEVAYCCVEGWTGSLGGTGNTGADPCVADGGYWAALDDSSVRVDWWRTDAVWVDGDSHLMSQGGRWLTDEGRWTTDDVTSPCIDAGDPMSPIGLEPFPNGGRVNMGAYGGTAEASKSYFGGPVCQAIVAGDINGDCRVDFTDVALLMVHWLADGAQAQ